MDFHDYLALLRRHVWIWLLIPVLCGAAAGSLALRQPKEYRATAVVLLRPNDPNERLESTSAGGTEVINADRIVRAQARIAQGPDVRRAAAQWIGGEGADTEIAQAIRVTPATDSNLLFIAATTKSPERSSILANAVADAFVENRRSSAVKGIASAVDDIDASSQRIKDELDALVAKPASKSNEILIQTLQEQYRALSDKRLQLTIDAELKRGESEVITDALPPNQPIAPRPVSSAIRATVASLFAVLALLLLRDRVDTRLRRTEEAEAISGYSAVGEIPMDKRAGRQEGWIAAREDPAGVVAEAMRSLRVSIRFLSIQDQAKIFLITSALPGDGKSTTATNLAYSYAQAGQQTLLVSADFRRPKVERLIEVSAAGGLSELMVHLAERKVAATAVRRRGKVDLTTPGSTSAVDLAAWSVCPEDGLYVMSAGRPLGSPVEILSSPIASEFFELARDQFDVVIVDSPPLLAVADPVLLAQYCDGVLIVTAMSHSTRKQLKRAVEIFQQNSVTRVLGLVVNRVTADSGGRYGGYGAYGYGYTERSPEDDPGRTVWERLTTRIRRPSSVS